MLTRLRLALLCALLLCAGQAEAQAALPNYDVCALVWGTAGFNVYQQTSPTGPKIKMGFVPVNGPDNTIVIQNTFPCPTAQGTYYYSLGYVDGLGQEGPHSGPTGFTVKGGAPPPPPPVFQIGAPVRVNTALLNVRELPNGVIKGQQKLGATATIVNGPVDLPLATPITVCGHLLTGSWRWWPLDYATGVDGWSAETCLRLVPVP